jgi:hypothetical protein
MFYGRAIPPAVLPILFVLSATAARADLASGPIASSPYGAIAAFAVVIGVITGIIIWRRRR